MSRRSLRLAVTIAFVGVLAGGLPAAADEQASGFHFEQVLSGYQRPTYVTASSNPNLLYVVEQRGRIRVAQRADAASPWQGAGVFLDIRSRVAGPLIGRGLLGMTFDPNYASNGLFYVFYTRRSSDPDLHGDIVIAEYRRLTEFKAKPRSRRLVLVIPSSGEYHFGGWLGFGPDGYLYLTTGDEYQPGTYPQDTNARLGKVLRLNPHAKRGRLAQVPPDNPFVGVDGDDLVWAYGLRNPWRASFDRATGDFWLADVGEYLWEEVNRFAPGTSSKGANLGWSLCEASHVYPPPIEGAAACEVAGAVAPLIEYPHADGNCSVIGGYVYRGTSQPNLVGRYFYGDFCTGNVWSVPATQGSGEPLGAPVDFGRTINSFGEDALGEVYLAAGDGTVWHVVQD